MLSILCLNCYDFPSFAHGYFLYKFMNVKFLFFFTSYILKNRLKCFFCNGCKSEDPMDGVVIHGTRYKEETKL